MKMSSQFQDAKAQFPNIDVWPGDRDGKIWPNSQVSPDGGIQFTVAYPLRNGGQRWAGHFQLGFRRDREVSRNFVSGDAEDPATATVTVRPFRFA